MIDLLADAGGWLAAAGLLLVLAYLIGVREWTVLIAGYDESLELPPAVAASIVGSFLARAGVAALVVAAAVALGDPPLLEAAFLVLLGVDLLRVLYRLNTYDATAR